jgi:transcriptional regulator with XRE-family HTH domain
VPKCHCITRGFSRQGKDFNKNLTQFLLTFCHLANYNSIMDTNNRGNLGEVIRQQRVLLSLTLQELAAKSEVSASHLGRVERGERFPSARILRRIAKPLGFEENELFTLAGYLSLHAPSVGEESPPYSSGRVDPYVATVLSREPVNVQRAVVGILTILKSIAESVSKE